MAMQPSTSEVNEQADDAPAEVCNRTEPILVTEAEPEEPSEPSTEPSKTLNRYERAIIGPGMQPILYHEKVVEDSLKHNVKPTEKKDKKALAERFSSWRQHRQDRRADAAS